MKLKIKETAWSINRISGGYRKKVTANVCFPCVLGDISAFGKGGRHFRIDEVSEEKIVLSVICADTKYNKSWEIEKGKEIYYRPRSFDGGYFYIIKLR